MKEALSDDRNEFYEAASPRQAALTKMLLDINGIVYHTGDYSVGDVLVLRFYVKERDENFELEKQILAHEIDESAGLKRLFDAEVARLAYLQKQ